MADGGELAPREGRQIMAGGRAVDDVGALGGEGAVRRNLGVIAAVGRAAAREVTAAADGIPWALRIWVIKEIVVPEDVDERGEVADLTRIAAEYFGARGEPGGSMGGGGGGLMRAEAAKSWERLRDERIGRWSLLWR